MPVSDYNYDEKDDRKSCCENKKQRPQRMLHPGNDHDLDGKERENFYLIKCGESLSRFDSADWAMSAEKERERREMNNTDERKRVLDDYGLDVLDEDEDKDDVFASSRRAEALQAEVVSSSSDKSSPGARVTARRLLCKVSSASSSGEVSWPPGLPPASDSDSECKGGAL